MNPSNVNSATASGTMSDSTPNSSGHQSDAGKLSESEFLEQQAKAAKAAIAGLFSELKTDLAQGVDPRVWMKSHPWITLASAAVAGFAAAATVVPSKEQQALRKLEAVERALHRARETPANGNGDKPPAGKKEHGGLLSMVLHELLGVIKPAIVSLISAQFSPQPEPPHPDDGHDDGGNG